MKRLKIKWITRKAVREAAKKSLRAAWRMSIEHWSQVCEAPQEEFMDALNAGKVNINACFCSLCQRVTLEGHKKCPFNIDCNNNRNGGSSCFVEWDLANNSLYTNYNKFFLILRHNVFHRLVVGYNKKYHTNLPAYQASRQEENKN